MTLSKALADKWAEQFGVETKGGQIISTSDFFERIIIDTLTERAKMHPLANHAQECPAVERLTDRKADFCGRCKTIILNCLEDAR